MSRVQKTKPTIAGIDEDLVRHELLRLKDQRFPASSRSDFESISGLYGSLVRQVERGSLPRLDAMARWTLACGESLSSFLAHCEELQATGRSKDFSAEHPLISDARSLVAKDRATSDDFHRIFRKLLARLGPPRK